MGSHSSQIVLSKDQVYNPLIDGIWFFNFLHSHNPLPIYLSPIMKALFKWWWGWKRFSRESSREAIPSSGTPGNSVRLVHDNVTVSGTKASAERREGGKRRCSPGQRRMAEILRRTPTKTRCRRPQLNSTPRVAFLWSFIFSYSSQLAHIDSSFITRWRTTLFTKDCFSLGNDFLMTRT